MNNFAISDAAVSSLRRQLAGRLVTPGEPEYDELRQAWNSTAQQRPALVVVPAGSDDVAATVLFAAANGRRVAVQATGHGAAGTLGDDVILVNMRELDGVQIDVERRTASVGAGATWGAVMRAAAVARLAGLAGTAPSVGVTGYTLHGGIGWLARAHGLASASLLSVDYIDAEGATRHTDESHDPEALWSFRGGAGLGIATRMELRLWPYGQFYGGAAYWPLDDAARVLERWLSWTEHVPESITSLVRVFQAPDVPVVPAPLRGRAVIVLGACATDLDDGRARIDGLFAQLPEPLMDSLAVRSPTELGEILPAPPGPAPARGDGRLLARPDTATALKIVRESGVGHESPLLYVELRHLGGRAADASVDGALTALPGEFLLDAMGAAPGSEYAGAVDAAFRRITGAAAAPVDLGRSVPGFRDGQTDAPGSLEPANRDRLRDLRRARDPERRLHHPRDLDT